MLDVLVIDDDGDLRSMLRDMLEELNCSVIEAEDGAAGVARLKETPVDLVITDILMPNQEGIETIVQLRKIKPDLPIVAMSGGGAAQNMSFLNIAKKLGANRVLEKPFTIEAITEVVTDFSR